MTELPYELPAFARELLRDANSILLCTHENPDADGMGSLLACGLALPRLGFDVARLGEEQLSPTLLTLSGHDTIPLDDGERAYDLAILFDCRVPARLGPHAPALERCAQVLVIDHHPPTADETSAGHDWVVPTAPATTLLALALIGGLGGIETVDADVATNLYAGLAVDTGGFRHPTTTAGALRAGALLVDRGARASEITEILLHQRRPEAIELLSKVMGAADYDADGRIVTLKVSQALLHECGAITEEAEGLISIASAIDGINLAIMFLEGDHGNWRVSLRAHAPWRVSEIAHEFGGGGHLLAAGFRSPGPLAELRPRLLHAALEELERGAARR
jgi:phosphoesterase RecJ-like protein